ncbi:hypothetical protein MVEN_00203500 [Mycena venus]|uniref:Uncharacterized protein n=1 Tax=Mycena venus TaxID=2733690 RepID=A0A8H7DAY0_9AGAR|nr:hypothetical protein MVEN_00203500 [Mycena venus]
MRISYSRTTGASPIESCDRENFARLIGDPFRTHPSADRYWLAVPEGIQHPIISFIDSRRADHSITVTTTTSSDRRSSLPAAPLRARSGSMFSTNPPTKDVDEETYKSRGMVDSEKKTVINLLEGFSVAVKHYLRGEDDIYYQDLYYLVKFLPAYALPAGISSNADLTNGVDADSTGTAGRSPILTRLSYRR